MRTFVRMFKPEFADQVQAGTKRQTVRPTPKRMPQAGDMISLRKWTGKPYRSPQVVLRNARIRKVEKIRILEPAGDPRCIFLGGWYLLKPAEVEDFSRADGFTTGAALVDWFRQQHGLPFSGIVIYWDNDGEVRP